MTSLDVSPLLNREFDPRDAGLTPEDYFVLTRVDGRTTFKQICLIAGFPEAQTLASLAKLRNAGAILLPGEPPPARRLRSTTTVGTPPTRPPAPPESRTPLASGTQPVDHRGKPPTDPPRQKRPSDPHPPHPTRARRPSSSEDLPRRAATATAPPAVWQPPVQIDVPAEVLAESADLTDEQKRSIFVKHALLPRGTLFDILEVDVSADRKALKRAYFRISKDFHPDRFFGKKLGSFHERLDVIFKTATAAFELLDDDGKRDAYRTRLAAAGHNTGPAQPAHTQTRAERAAEQFDLACQHEVTGNLELALAEFSAATQLDPQGRYFRRAIEASLRAERLSAAEEYAKKFALLSPRDAVALRMLAKVLRALGRHEEAHRELETASRLDPDNVHIAAELEELAKLVADR